MRSLQALLLICVVHASAPCWLFLFIYIAWEKKTVIQPVVEIDEISALFWGAKEMYATISKVREKNFHSFLFLRAGLM